MDMPDPKRLLWFFVRFVVVFGLLVFPWPGFREQFACGLQGELRVFFHLTLPRLGVEVRYGDRAIHSAGDTEIWKSSPATTHHGGQLEVKKLVCDSRSLGWMPHAMMLALCSATPLTWKRWCRVFLSGVIGTHLLVLATFTAGLFSTYADEISNSLVRWLVMGAGHILIDNLWISFVGPFLLWIVALVIFGGAEELYSTPNQQLGSKKRTALMHQFTARCLGVALVLWVEIAVAQTPRRPPEISAQPQNQMLLRGSSARFTVSATGTDLTYQWFLDETQALASAIDSQLTLTNIQSAWAGDFRLNLKKALVGTKKTFLSSALPYRSCAEQDVQLLKALVERL